MNLSKMFEVFFSKNMPKPVPIPNTASVEGKVIREALTPFTTNLWLSDGMFKYMTVESLQEFLNSDGVSNREYKAEVHDCDDFCYELMGRVSEWNSDNTFGIVWGLNAGGGGHAWNFFVDEANTVWFVEPQSDYIFKPTTEKIWIMIV